ncbi:Uncharacterised protein [Leminorella grimontii]|nr:Uncharacterised protein [Leminorella grimontii]
MECSIYPDYDNEGVVEIVARENGKIDGVQYRVSHTGKDVIGSVGNPFGWEFSCEAGRSGHVCFVEGNGDRFYLQYTSQIEKANIPSGYLISMGKNSVFQIVNLSIDGKDIKPDNTYSIIYGKQASEFISQIKEKSVVMVSYNTPSNRQGEYKIEGEDMQIMRASIPLIKKAFELYNE